MRFWNTGKKGHIYFWEKITFRILAGFLIPILISAYALFYLSGAYSDVSEADDFLQQSWNSVRMAEGRSQLALTEVRMTALTLVFEGSPEMLGKLKQELRDFHRNLEQGRKTTYDVTAANHIQIDGQVNKIYGQIDELENQLNYQVDRMSDAIKRQNSADAAGVRKEIDRIASEVETAVSKLGAGNEYLELKMGEQREQGRARMNRVLGFFLVAVFFFTLVSAILVSSSVTSPVWQIIRRIKNIAMGNGDLSARVVTRSGGEMRELASWMNLLLDRTESIISTMAEASRVISDTTEKVGQQTGMMSVAASGISKNMMEQSMNMDECTSALSGIDDLIRSSGESTRQAASLSKIAMDRALQGGASVHETIEAMEKIEESSLKIEELVSSINDIASQTNLLAINAAIEATKAGEHGKGFAVVAEEVRKLAERARRLTGEVTSLMAESGSRVKAGVSLAKGAGVSLDGIIKDVEAVASLIQRVAASASKQAQSSNQVLESMQKVSDVVRTNLTELHQVNRATELTSGEVTRLEALVGQLNDAAGEFQVRERSPRLPALEIASVPEAPTEEAGASQHFALPPIPSQALEPVAEAESDQEQQHVSGGSEQEDPGDDRSAA